MTSPTIPPCPVCGNPQSKPNDDCMCCIADYFPAKTWAQMCEAELGRACRELGIETVEQLKTRLAPDPRVAVLEAIQALLDEWPKYRDSVLGRKDDPPCSVCGGELDTGWECNACGHDMQMEVCPDIKLWGQITRLIAAQRGEAV